VPWNGDIHDLGQMRASKRDIVRRREQRVSHNAEAARRELQEKLAAMRGELRHHHRRASGGEEDDDDEQQQLMEEIAAVLDALNALTRREGPEEEEEDGEGEGEDPSEYLEVDPMARHLPSSPLRSRADVEEEEEEEEQQYPPPPFKAAVH
jgi:hypothetical protein